MRGKLWTTLVLGILGMTSVAEAADELERARAAVRLDASQSWLTFSTHGAALVRLDFDPVTGVPSLFDEPEPGS